MTAQRASRSTAAPSAISAPIDTGERTAEMGVENMTFLIDRMYEDCAPGQFIREFTKNGLQALGLLPDPKGRVLWTVYRSMFDSTGVSKLCCIDTGIGMSGPEMVARMNSLASSGHVQSHTQNYGVGAKISAVPANPEGLIYLSWKDGKGAMVILWKDPVTGKYGLRPQDNGDGTFSYWVEIGDAAKPKEIDTHGTAVVFLGRQPNDDTTGVPPGMIGGKRWILRQLNSRFYRFPDGVTVASAEGWERPESDKHRFDRDVDGLAAWLERVKQSNGSVPLTDAVAHWWVLPEAADVNSGHYPSLGVVAALWQDELYDLVFSRQGNARLQQFGVIFGTHRVALVIEPSATLSDLTTDTARTTLILSGESLPWVEWAAEFREKMPREIATLMEEVGRKTGSTDHRQSIKERLRDLGDLFHFSRYQAVSRGRLLADPRSRVDGDEDTLSEVPTLIGPVGPGEPDTTIIEPGEEPVDEPTVTEPERERRKRLQKPRTSDYFTRLIETKKNAEPAQEVQLQELPITHWLTAADRSRAPGQMEDRAAQYLPDTNTLLINGDFRVFTDMETRWARHYRTVPGAGTVVRKVVREWFEQQLIEAILAARALEGGKHWMDTDIAELYSEKTLTAVVLPRFHVDRMIKRTLGDQIASLSRLATAVAPVTGSGAEAESD